MARTTIIFGLLLVVLGVGGYLDFGRSSLTALIPALFGLALLICAAIAIGKPSVRIHVIHVAVLIGLLGAIAGTHRAAVGIARLLDPDADAKPGAVIATALMGFFCAAYVILAIRSFLIARRQRRSRSPRS